MVNVLDNSTFKIGTIPFFQLFLLFLLIGMIIVVHSLRNSVRKEKRIRDFSIAPDTDVSILKYYRVLYVKFIKYLAFKFKDSVLLNKYGKYYDVYVDVVNPYYKKGSEFLISEIVFSLLWLLIIYLAFLLNGYFLNVFLILLVLLFGMLFIMYRHYKKFSNYRKEIDKAFYEFMTILLAFLQKHSFDQSLELLINKTQGAVKAELKKMQVDIRYGLSIQQAFIRCYERTKIHNFQIIANYIYAVPNVGGNIVDSFTLSYNTLLDKSKMERYVFTRTFKFYMFLIFLSFIQCVVFLCFLFFNNDYFSLLTSTIIGRLIIFIICIVYIVYILGIRFIIKGCVRL